MRKRRRVLVVLTGLAVALAAALVPGAVASDAEQRVMITERMQLTGPTTQQGTWVGAGAVNDAGQGSATFTVVPNGDGKGLLTGTHVLTGSAGTITIETKAWGAPLSTTYASTSHGGGNLGDR